ncbi:MULTISPECIES: molecular chaperone HtpG [Cupriavidus]|uniref:Chaperone protein HtpG n=1 Tax=Cupriavidus metallidurans (strain ATCC 43123 / DSM 2839 / NBRC 102507 / CH34) TaxID=266264 RepID=HTPG_CUPMC|nr:MULTISPECIES: molecular chaperone HtpG [Cupriavidus]Q1LKE3.1 RecName: Full=Chaperone protein HtpG; AltName: Full=Heat shock protein HtpG; AltName: Full=High temperature protein G [Cupriavidus metallidurans CH34]ABF09383.1 molecular chaperone HSP90 family [Cupriavidus metallidurans CH34]EKZ97747.1 heat shock protein 90 [Cupriavidus sp. HMR-1]QGS29753.1 molecular chaperone HtpG [Cupriavidus metallidurans]UBM10091.1 molecular chaperone HtpG [Cupriavidus metallidurans]
MTAPHETMSFQAEVKQLLHLMIHSLYSNKEIFLRELVSNASDATDKLRFEAIANPALLENDADLAIRIEADPAARTLKITDNGIGMSRDEAIRNLGTIARSGTKEFFQQLSGDQQKDAALIGQFGVGFYSAFIVADKVTVETRRAGLAADEAVRWESAGDGEFSIDAINRAERGSTITLHLREGEDDFLSSYRLQNIIRKYSDHISLPIRMPKEEWDAEAQQQKVTGEWESVNQASALWTRSKSDITDEQYQAFYQHIAHDHEAPLAWTHNRVEGRSEYTQLLYIPARAPFDLWDRNHKAGLKLYVKRVFIMDDADQLLPAYLRWVKGVVDSADLPLNVSRELLQESRDVKAIREGCAKRVLSMLEAMADSEDEAERAKYKTFWEQFGQVLKEGVGEDHGNGERIAKLLRFATTHGDTAEQSVSLVDYVGRMKEGQDKIYYVTADTWVAAKSSPHLEVFRKKGIEVVLLTDRVDEWLLSYLHEFDGKQLVSVARGDLDLGALADEAEKAEQEKASADWKEVVDRAKSVLEGKAKDVRVTLRLTDSASCLVSDDGDMSGYLQRLLKQAGQKAPDAQPILELNPEHALVKKLRDLPDGEAFGDRVRVLFDQALLAEGGMLDDPAAYVQRVNRLLA